MRDDKELTNIPIHHYLLGAIGGYLEAHSQGEVTLEDLEPETIDKIKDLCSDILSVLIKTDRTN